MKTDIYIFPYEKVKKNAKVIIWGIGNVGKTFVSQLMQTKYCEVVRIVDTQADKFKGLNYCGLEIFTPEVGLSAFEYDYIVISIDNKNSVEKIKRGLILSGIDNEKIVDGYERGLTLQSFKTMQPKEIRSDKFIVKIINDNGIGDALFDLYLIDAMKREYGEKIKIHFICKCLSVFKNEKYIDELFDFNEEPEDCYYDLVLLDRRIMYVRNWNEEKVKLFSAKLYDFCKTSQYYAELIYDGREDFIIANRLSLINKGNRFNQMNLKDIWKFNEDLRLTTGENEKFPILKKFGLEDKRYITLNRGDGHYNELSPKMWPLERYNGLVSRIKEFSDIYIVQIGASKKFGIISGIDINLVEKTTLEELKVILGCSLLHVDNEGGLVHLRHFLGGQSIVLFGPTQAEIFGYKDNINISKCECKEPCSVVTSKWYKRCIRTGMYADCMNNISVTDVFKQVEKKISLF